MFTVVPLMDKMVYQSGSGQLVARLVPIRDCKLNESAADGALQVIMLSSVMVGVPVPESRYSATDWIVVPVMADPLSINVAMNWLVLVEYVGIVKDSTGVSPVVSEHSLIE